MTAPLVEARSLRRVFPVSTGFLRGGGAVRAVDGVDLDIGVGEIVGLVGESGSGKTTLGRLLLRLIEPDAGRVVFDGVDVTGLSAGQLRRFRRRMQVVFQDPSSSLNPRMKVRNLIAEPLVVHGIARGARLREKVDRLLSEVGLEREAGDRYPREFSGGQRQRIGIARALALRPELIVCDEPVSSLDVSVQAQIINLLVDLQRKHGMAYLFIAHDLALVGHLCDRIAVMYLGKIVEEADGAVLREMPLHPYTRALFESSLAPDPAQSRGRAATMPGEIPSPVDLPSGCRFHPRCPLAEPRCRESEPRLRTVGPRHRAACHLLGQEGGSDS